MKKKFAMVGIFATIALVSNALAGNWINRVEIVDTRWYSSEKGFITIDHAVDPGNCGSSLATLYIDNTIPGYEEIRRKADLALISSRYVDIIVEGCQESVSSHYNKIFGIRITNELVE